MILYPRQFSKLTVNGFTPGAVYNIFKVDCWNFTVYAVKEDTIHFLSSSNIGPQLKKLALMNSQSNMIKRCRYEFINFILYIRDSKTPQRSLWLTLCPKTGEEIKQEIKACKKEERFIDLTIRKSLFDNHKMLKHKSKTAVFKTKASPYRPYFYIWKSRNFVREELYTVNCLTKQLKAILGFLMIITIGLERETFVSFLKVILLKKTAMRS